MKLNENEFLDWVHSTNSELIGFNPASTQQVQQLLFAPCYKKLTGRNKLKYLKKRKLDSNGDIIMENEEGIEGKVGGNEYEIEEGKGERELEDEKNNEEEDGENSDEEGIGSASPEDKEDSIGNFSSKQGNSQAKARKSFVTTLTKNSSKGKPGVSSKLFTKKEKQENIVEVLPKSRVFKIENTEVSASLISFYLTMHFWYFYYFIF